MSLDPQSRGNALLLTTNTEVSIAPKLHRESRQQPPNPQVNTTSQQALFSSTEKSPKLSQSLPQILRVVPPRVLPLSLPAYNGPEILGYVSAATLTKLCPEITAQNEIYHQFHISHLHPPTDPSAPSQTTATATPVAKVLKPGDGENPAVEASPKKGKVHLAPMDGIPNNHIVLPKLVDDVKEWDLVR